MISNNSNNINNINYQFIIISLTEERKNKTKELLKYK